MNRSACSNCNRELIRARCWGMARKVMVWVHVSPDHTCYTALPL